MLHLQLHTDTQTLCYVSLVKPFSRSPPSHQSIHLRSLLCAREISRRNLIGIQSFYDFFSFCLLLCCSISILKQRARRFSVSKRTHILLICVYWPTFSENWPFTLLCRFFPQPSTIERFIDGSSLTGQKQRIVVVVHKKNEIRIHTGYNYNNLKFSADVTVHRRCCFCAKTRSGRCTHIAKE